MTPSNNHVTLLQAFVDDGVVGKGWADERPMNLTADYPARLLPNQRLSTIMIRDLGGHFPGGTFTVTYRGKGVLDFSMDVKVRG